MASSSSNIKRYDIFSSFHGPDVRTGFLSHLHKQFASKGITTFKDQKLERGHTIGPELVKAIRESRTSIVVLSKNYASSSWCLNELVEIFKCKEEHGQTVMTIFYDVDPSHVRKQSGDFGRAFENTCKGKTEEVRQRWSKVLTDVAEIAGEHSQNWVDEAAMVEKIVTDVSNKQIVTSSRDFDRMVGLKAHLTKLNSLLRLECDEVKMIGIWGPAGIGKSTIARALYNQLSTNFPLKCFMREISVDRHYDSKLALKSQLLSEVLNQRDMKVNHLGAIKERLHDQRVLIILDDVDDLETLEVLVEETSWFGPGSRILVTTEDEKILKAHGIDIIYRVDFPSKTEALEILSLSAFKQSSVQDGFEELAEKIAEFCSNLPLALSVVGSSLRGQRKNEWEFQLSRIENSLDRKIEDVLRVGYDRLSKNDQSIFLHIACFFFFDEDVDYLTTMLARSNLDVRNGLKTLIHRSLVHISFGKQVVMHYLLKQLGKQVVVQQSDEPGKRQFLVEAAEIRDVLQNETGTGSLIGISFDWSKMGEFSINGRAFIGMRNLQFLRVYKQFSLKNEDESFLCLQENLEYLPRLKLLYWPDYPRKSLPATFQPDRLVELNMRKSGLEKLWDGIQPLANLKTIRLEFSYRLKEIPNLSKATNLETLELLGCKRLVELPSSIRNLHKLKKLNMSFCKKLRVIPTDVNLASLEEVDMSFCSQLRTFPDISSNIKTLSAAKTQIEDVPTSIVGRWSRLEFLNIGSRSLKRLTHVPLSVKKLDLSNSCIKKIPDCVIGLPHLENLIVENCPNLVSIPALSPSLKFLYANDCASLKTVCCSFHNPTKVLAFYNCLQLDKESRRQVIQQSVSDYICFPAKRVPAEFTHKATGNSVTIPLAPGGVGNFSASSRFKACFLLSPFKDSRYIHITCVIRSKDGAEIDRFYSEARISFMSPRWEHLFTFHGDSFRQRNRCHEVDVATSEIIFEFGCCYMSEKIKIMECGVQILAEEATSSSCSSKVDNFETESSSSNVDNFETGGNSNHHTDGDGNYETEALMVSQGENIKTSIHTGFWSWLRNGLKKMLSKKERTSHEI